MSALLGRERLREEIAKALTDHDMVTLVGPGGVGKTSLARAVPAPEAGVGLFIDLSAARQVDGCLSALAAGLGVHLADVERVEDAVATLAAGLGERDVERLVLDCCEHVREPAAVLLEAARGAGVRVLCTSREPLLVPGEQVLEVPALPLQDAVALLRVRAQKAGAALEDSDDTDARLGRIVERLDRLPLAIELFAGRLDLLGLDELESRLSAPLAVLRDPAAPAGRHADVSSTVRWSWELLSPALQRVLEVLSAFVSGATFGSLERALVELGHDGPVLDELASLRRKHLVVGSSGPLRRFTLLETVRAFVQDVLEAEGRAGDVALAHARAMTAADSPWRAPTAAGHRALAVEVDNLAAALHRVVELAPEVAAEAAVVISPHMAFHGPIRAHLDMLDRGVEAADRSADPQLVFRVHALRADARRKAGRLSAAAVDLEVAEQSAPDKASRAEVRASVAMLRMVEGDLPAAALAIDEAIALAEQADDDLALGLALQRAGAIHLVRGAYPVVEEMCSRALSALEPFEHLRGTTNALTYLGIARLDRGNPAEATAAFEEARALYAEAADEWSIAVCDAYLGLILLDEGDLPGGLATLERAHGLARRVGHARVEAFIDGVRGIGHHLAEDYDAAEACCRRGVGLALKLNDLLAAAVSAGHLAGVLADRGGALDEARHFLAIATRSAQLLPNPSARGGVVAMEGLVALAEGDRASATAQLSRAQGEGVHLRLARALLERRLAPEQGGGHTRVGLSADGRTLLLPDDTRVDLTRRGPLRRILQALAAAHAEGGAIDVYGLIEAGWPGESPSTEAGMARVYTAVRSLRKLGLEDVLVTRDDGYALAPGTDVYEVSDSER